MDITCRTLSTDQQFARRILVQLLCCLVTPLALLLESADKLYAQSSPPTFVLQSTLPYHGDATTLAAGDFNRDGAIDLVVGNRGQNQIYWNDGHNQFPTVQPLGSGEQTVDVTIGDINGDGYGDILVYNKGAPSMGYLNDGRGNFAPSLQLDSASGDGDLLRLGDLDGDGDYDLVAARMQGNSTVYRNNGHGQFTAALQLPAGFAPQLIDDDGDGDLDLFLLQRDTNQPTKSYLYRYRNNGQGQLAPSRLSLPGGKAFVQSFVAADLDGNGRLDFVVSSVTSGCAGTGCEDLRLVVDRPLLGYASLQLDSEAAGRLQLADFDNDGDLDIAATGLAVNTAQSGDRQSRIYLQNSINLLLPSASFTPLNVGTAQSDARDLAVADLNNDGLLDLALAANDNNGIYQNQPGYFFAKCVSNLLLLDPRLMADLNNDTYPDLILQSGLILYNDKAGGFQPGVSLSLLLALDSQLATADLNGDGWLDLIAAYRDRAAVIYLQTAGGQFMAAGTLDANSFPATALATGDINSDGYLDLVVGRGSSSTATNSLANPNVIYLNNGNGSFGVGIPFGAIADDTQAIALGDLDADGDLDIAVANATVIQGQQQGQQNYLYFNDGNGLFGEPRALGPGTDRSRAIAAADLNGDGYLDLVVGNETQLNALYVNDGSGGFQQAVAIGQLPDATTNVLLADLDQDRDIDLIAVNDRQSDALYLNDGHGQLTAMPAWAEPTANARARVVAAGDLDRDGDIDLVTDLQPLSIIPELVDCIMTAERTATPTAAEHLPKVVLRQPGSTVGSGPYASPQLFAQAEIPFSFTLFDPAARPVDVRGYYSFNGGGQWFPAVAKAGTQTTNLTTKTGNGVAQYTFIWDVYGSNFLGHSDNVVFRLEVMPSQQPATNGQPRAAPRSYVAAESYPFRVRGTQVRVVNEQGSPVVGALLYKLSADATTRADSFPLRNGQPVRTNAMGFIESRGQLSPGDQLVALQPISATHAFTLYYSSATPTATGLNPYVVQAAGVQTLTVRADNPLTLFNLNLSLEWDARNDDTFLTDLARAIENASDVLFDVSEGQVALGDVTVYQAKEGWSDANVVIYASNSIHPRATMGGIVITPTNESGINGIIPAAYWPGQIRMGPQWDPFGQNEAELRQDWWLAFAHELSHYLLFLPDNYLGVENGLLRNIDCQGSFMTNTYEETYREFLTRDRWDRQEDCWRKSIAAHTTGRADWETVRTFLPWLHMPINAAATNPGPTWLPLRTTRVVINAPQFVTPQPLLPTRNFDLRNSDSGEITRLRRAEAYLIKARNTPQLEDDEMIALGSTGAGSDRIRVRGAQAGDRLCLFQADGTVPLLGCEVLQRESTSIRLHAVPDWQPQITVTPVNSVTVTIDIIQPIGAGQQLRVQLLPAGGTTLDGKRPVAAWAAMQPVTGSSPDHFRQTITLAQPLFEGFVRVWVDNDPLGREAISQFFLSAGWGPNSRPTSHVDRGVWGPNSRPTSHANQRSWGANTRAMEAPVASGDGKVTIFNLDDVLGDTGASALQVMTTFPALPLWLTPVGSGYRYIGDKTFKKTIAFHYLEREVPKGYEHTLAIYYWSNRAGTDGTARWQRLTTLLDMDENLAAAEMVQNVENGQGIYALAATVEMPPLVVGWNLFAYPIPGERDTATALASLTGAYSVLYHFDPTRPQPWVLYDPAVVTEHPDFAPWVNDLTKLSFGASYWIHATAAITPYLGIGGDGGSTARAAGANSLLPPATIFGPITTDSTMTLSTGMTLTATIDSQPCGVGEIRQVNNGWLYKIQVAAGDGHNGCGYADAPISLSGPNFKALAQSLWDSRHALYQPLTVTAQEPSSGRPPGDQTDAPDRQPTEGHSGTHQIFLPILLH